MRWNWREGTLLLRSSLVATLAAVTTCVIPGVIPGVAAAPAAGTKCAACHTEQARMQPETPMSHALLTPGANAMLKGKSKLTYRLGAYSYTIEHGQPVDTYTVTDGVNRMSLPIRWVFGVNSQTYVLEYQGRMFESLVSYYEPLKALNITIGDEKIQPKSLVEAMGREISKVEARACFQCHATKAVSNDEIQTESLVPGVQCERCHVGVNAHADAISRGKVESVPPKLSRLSAEDMSNFCGQCHRSFSDVVRDRLFGQLNVRFQPYRLANSKCFDGSDARLSCVACHNPHKQLVTDTASYDANCQACHQSSTSKPAAGTLAKMSHKSCPVATSNCVSCHMPKVELPGGHKAFRDHFIRVVRAGEPYPN